MADWSVRRSDDFPPVGSSANRLLCCTTTCCCLTFVAGGIGLLVGGGIGIVSGVRGGGKAAQRDVGVFGIILGTLVRFVAFAVLGAAAGAGIGFLLDSGFGTFR